MSVAFYLSTIIVLLVPLSIWCIMVIPGLLWFAPTGPIPSTKVGMWCGTEQISGSIPFHQPWNTFSGAFFVFPSTMYLLYAPPYNHPSATMWALSALYLSISISMFHGMNNHVSLDATEYQLLSSILVHVIACFSCFALKDGGQQKAKTIWKGYCCIWFPVIFMCHAIWIILFDEPPLEHYTRELVFALVAAMGLYMLIAGWRIARSRLLLLIFLPLCIMLSVAIIVEMIEGSCAWSKTIHGCVHVFSALVSGVSGAWFISLMRPMEDTEDLEDV